MVSIYADGSSTGKATGPGGWAYVLVRDGQAIGVGYGGWKSATNNQMELMAAIRGLESVGAYLQEGELVELVCDSQYVLGLASGAFTASKNQELVRRLVEATTKVKVKRFRWVRGHSGDPLNERVDRLAKMGKEAQRVVQQGS